MLFDKICGFASLLGLLLTVTSWFAAGCQMNIYWLVVLVPLLLLSLFTFSNTQQRPNILKDKKKLEIFRIRLCCNTQTYILKT